MQPDQTKTGMPDMRKSEARELLKKAKDRYKVMAEFDHENRQEGMEDLKFINVPGEQWDENMKQERGQRPCFEFNKTRISVKRVINDMRANRPGAKVRAVEDADTEVADIYEGLIRNIAEQSDFDTVVDYEAEYQVGSGMCAWRINTKYTQDDAFNQDIIIEPLRNPFTAYCDPQARDILKRDARDWCITEKIAKSNFEERWPDAEVIEFDPGEGDEYDDEGDWTSEKTVRIAEYWYKKPVKKEIWECIFLDEQTGESKTLIVDSTTDEARGIDPMQIQRRRTINSNEIHWCIVSGDRILESGKWAGPDFPFVMVYGEYAWIDGRPYWWGLPRFAKDAQRAYNIDRTAMLETIAQAPKSYFWATQKQAEGHLSQWQQAHKKNYPYMLYEPDERAPGPPMRVGGADVPVALIQSTQMSSDEIKAVTGIFDASMGASGNETSGRAIFARQAQGEIATFNYQDNMSKGVQRTYEIILNLIPHIYDTERSIRVLGSDGAEDYKKVNEEVYDPETGRTVKVNDLAGGKYDVTVTTGPSFSTLRQEAAEVYTQFAQQYPELMGVAGDLVMKSIDLPYADDIAERLQTMLPPQIQQMINADKEMPPEVQQAMAQVEQAAAVVEEKSQMIVAAEEELKQLEEQVKEGERQNKVAGKDVEIRIERLRRVKAEFDADIAKSLANLEQKQQDLKMAAAEQNANGAGATEDTGDAVIAVAQAVRSIDETLSAFMQETDAALQGLQAGNSLQGGGNLPAEIPDAEGIGDGDMET